MTPTDARITWESFADALRHGLILASLRSLFGQTCPGTCVAHKTAGRNEWRICL